jgi:outer membrane protein assembly factor BamB
MKSLLAVAAALSCALNASAADWPQWRGPNREGVSSEKVKWPAGGPKVIWKASVGTGFSSVSVSHGRVYTMGNEGEKDTIWCLDAAKGKPVWQHTYDSALNPQYYEGGPGATPTVQGGRVFTISKWGDVFCLDAENGTVIWEHHLLKDRVHTNRWGFAGSPLIWKDLVILNAGSSGVALDSATGRIAWLNGTNAAGYASPLLFKVGNKEEVLIFAAKHLIAVDPQTGAELWRFPWETGYDTNNTDPLVRGNIIFISSYNRGCALLRVTDNKPGIVYQNKELFSHLSPGILIGEYLYAFSGEARMKTDFRCIHLPTGELKWKRDDPGFGSLIRAGGELIILSEKGELLLGEPSADSLRVLGRSQVLGGLCWTPPALADGRVYARNAKGELVCLQF